MKLNLGAGGDIREGYINHDMFSLSGIDIVHDINLYPWPWADNSFEEVIAYDLLEHLDNFMEAIEEIHRILLPGGILKLSVPYWNSCVRYIDPTHKTGFHEDTFKFFDPSSHYCQERFYYTKARFSIEEEVFILTPFFPYFWIPKMSEIKIINPIIRRIIGFIGNVLISNFIVGLHIKMKKLPAAEN
jgi:SAM-dependent methyltransferase